MFDAFVSNLIVSERKTVKVPQLLSQPIVVPTEIVEPVTQVVSERGLTLSDAWAMYKDEKGRDWAKSVSMANERYMEVLLTVLGGETDVTMIPKQDIKQVMEAVENLPKRVVQPYHSMTIQQLIDGVVAAPSKARFGAYSTAEMKKFVGWALKQPDNW